MNGQHTPGPWNAERCPCGVCSTYAVTSPCEMIAKKANRANAHLIAAAPDLYEALKALVADARRVGIDDGLADQIDSKVFAQAEAALSRIPQAPESDGGV